MQNPTTPSVALVVPQSQAALAVSTASAALEPYTPRSYEQALAMAGTLAKAARITPEEAFLKMAVGAEYGIPATTALRQVDCIPGPNGSIGVGFRAQLMVALCLRAREICEYFRFVEGDGKSATYAAKRQGEPEQRETYTIEQAKQAGLIKTGGAWEKDPASQLIARASSRLARRVFPDILGNLYTPDELQEAAAGPLPAAPVQPLPSAPGPRAADVVDGEIIEGDEARIVRLLTEAATETQVKALAAEAVKVWPQSRPESVKAAHAEAKRRVATPAHNPQTGEVREPGADDA